MKTRDLTEFGYRRSYSPGLSSHNTKETSRYTTTSVLTKPEPPPYHTGSIGKRPYTTIKEERSNSTKAVSQLEQWRSRSIKLSLIESEKWLKI